MKDLGLFVLALLSPVLVSAQQLELPLENPNSSQIVEKVLASLNGKDAWDVFAVANGDFQVLKYDVSKFDQAYAIQNLEEGLVNGENECVYETQTGEASWKKMIEIEGWSAHDAPDGLEILKTLEATGETLFVASREWDGMSGESEYCQKFDFDIYFKGGKLLSIQYDITD